MYRAKLISSTKDKYEKYKDIEAIFLNTNGMITLLNNYTKKTILQTPIIISFNFIQNILIINTLNGFFSFEFLNELPKLKLEKNLIKLLLSN